MLRVSYCDSDVSVMYCSTHFLNILACVRSRGHILSPIIMKVGQNVCLDEISDETENGSCRVTNKVTRSNLGQTLGMLWRPHFQCLFYKLINGGKFPLPLGKKGAIFKKKGRLVYSPSYFELYTFL